jgi:hypothetical protein
MAKEKNEHTSRVVRLTKETDIRLKKIFIAYDELSVKLTVPEICDQIFELGIRVKETELQTRL